MPEFERLSLNKLKWLSNVANKIDDYINGLVDANKFISEGKFIEGIKKIDLMGGKVSQLGGDFVNIDIQATKGINGSVTDLNKFIKPNSIDEIVCNNPYNPDILDPFELYINNAKKVLKRDGTITINAQPRNPLFRDILKEKCEQLGFEVMEFKIPLSDKYKNLNFGTTGGTNSINPNSMQTIILKKK